VLSSIDQQYKCSSPVEILVNIASMPNNGNPTTEEVIKWYMQNTPLLIKHTVFTDKELFSKPSLTKNVQIKDSDCDYFVFHSADQVFHPEYFRTLYSQLTNGYGHVDNCMGGKYKWFSEYEATEKLVNSENTMYIENSFKKVGKLPKREEKTSHRLGGHLIVNRQAILDKNDGYYIKPENCNDRHLFNRGMKTRSDIRFRSAMGGCTHLPLPPQVHLEHRRDKEEGYHLEDQR
jgi:hypothetical protein